MPSITSFSILEEEIICLGIVTRGEVERIFSTEVPLWPEAVLIREWGHKAAEKFDLTFYFPSENEPDDNCPGWHQRHLAVNCKDCNKLIIPTDSPYLPKEICYSCHLLRERNQEIQNDTPYDERVTMFLSNGEVDEHIGYCSFFKDFAIAPYIFSLVEHLKLSELFYCWQTASVAFFQSKHYMIYFKNGFSKRVDAILRFVNYVCNGTADISDVIKRFKSIITEVDVLKTLKKLEKNDCLSIAQNKLQITRTGKNIV